MNIQGNSLTVKYEHFENASELPESDQKLLEAAFTACDLAYAPYSGFHVGCAIQLADGDVIIGNNQENKAYPSGLCAERTALFYAGALGKGKDIRKIAVRGRSNQKLVDVPVTPCGACRQVMLEYEQLAGVPIEVLMQGETGKILKIKGIVPSLLPFGFDLEF